MKIPCRSFVAAEGGEACHTSEGQVSTESVEERTGMELSRVLPEAWSDDVVAVLREVLVERSLPEGAAVIRRGTEDAGLHLVVHGMVAVHDDDGRELAVLGPGSWVGELGWLDGAPAGADVVAVGDVVVASATDDAKRRLGDFTEVCEHLRQLAAKRRATNRVVDLDPVAFTDAGGAALALRPMWPDDWRLLRDNDGRVSAESLRRRFFTQPSFSEDRLRGLADVDFRSQFAWVVIDADGLLQAVGRYGRPVESPERAEIALLVADAWQGRGLGRLLMSALAIAAEAQGVEKFEALALADNRPIRGLLEDFGAAWQRAGEATQVEALWPARDAGAAIPEWVPSEKIRAVVQAALSAS